MVEPALNWASVLPTCIEAFSLSVITADETSVGAMVAAVAGSIFIGDVVGVA
jgi:hypothetical protein